MKYRRILGIAATIVFCPTLAFADLEAIVNVDSLVIRSEKSADAPVVAELPANTRIEIEQMEGKWGKTNYLNYSGYVYGDYIDVYSVKAGAIGTFKKEFRVKDSPVIFEEGEQVPIYDHFNHYYLVKKDYGYFYIHSSLLDIPSNEFIESPKLIKSGIDTSNKYSRVLNENLVIETEGALKGDHKSIFFDDTEDEVFSEEFSLVLQKNDNISDIPNTQSNTPSKQNGISLSKSSEKNATAVSINKNHQKQKSNEMEEDIERVQEGSGRSDKTKQSGNFDNEDKIRTAMESDFGHFIKNSYILTSAVEELGKPYIYGTQGPNTFDCSGFTSYVYKKNGINIPRTSAMQAEKGEWVEKEDLRAGDLIFFDTRKIEKLKVFVSDEDSNPIIEGSNGKEGGKTIIKPSKVTHVGMYIGDGKFIHASSGARQVVITDLSLKYYSDRYYGARRYK